MLWKASPLIRHCRAYGNRFKRKPRTRELPCRPALAIIRAEKCRFLWHTARLPVLADCGIPALVSPPGHPPSLRRGRPVRQHCRPGTMDQDLEILSVAGRVDSPATRDAAAGVAPADRLVQRASGAYGASGSNAQRSILSESAGASSASPATTSTLAARRALRATAGTRRRTARRSLHAGSSVPRWKTCLTDHQSTPRGLSRSRQARKE